jgi:Sec7-like guanine-nucleotide exchange factor
VSGRNKSVTGNTIQKGGFCFIFPGDYLGEKKPFNEQVLKAFVELHDFTNLILVQALR